MLVDAISNPFRFPGQYYDRETTLNYNFFRYYDLNIGRYTKVDPKQIKRPISGYLYVSMNPLRFYDSFGLRKWSGWVISGSFGYGIFSSTIQHYYLKTKCVHGWQWNANVNAVFADIGISTPINIHASTHVTYEDPLPEGSLALPRWVFAGVAARLGPEANLDGIRGVGLSGATVLGRARNFEFMHLDKWTWGLGAGAIVFSIGRSWVTDEWLSKCGECWHGDGSWR